MSFAENIRAIRRARILSQANFAKVMGVSAATINRWESGKSLPNAEGMELLREYCELHHLDLDALFE